ncbi:EamA family transporter [Pseudonocardia nigra]|uniref:EamA family transporter n=1 Tax=Pseudonocardia nigra TaxID=1921578 RepID=UPI001C5D4128
MPSGSATPSTNAYDHAARASERPSDQPSPVNFEDPLIINFTLIANEGPTAASIVTYLVPAVALLLGILVLNEPARLTLPLGALLILAGVAFTRARRSPARPSP